MSKAYSKNNNERSPLLIESSSTEVQKDDEIIDGSEVTESLPTVKKEEPVYEVPVKKPVVSQPQPNLNKMLKIQTDLVALSQAMKPKQSVSGKWQYSLFKLIKAAIENPDAEAFEKEWLAILSFFNRAKETNFSWKYILHPSEDWSGSEADFTLYRRLIHVITETAEPSTRAKSLRGISFSRATDGLSEQGRNSLVGFYG